MVGIFEKNKENQMLYCIKDLNYGCPLHFHNNIELLYILSGNHEALVNENIIRLTSNDICFCNPFDVHQFSSFDKGEIILLTFDISYYEGSLCFLNKANFPNYLNNKEQNIKIKSILKILLTNKSLNNLEKQGYINLIMGNIYKNYKMFEIKKNITNEAIKEIILFINENYQNDINRDDIAKKFGYTPNYFSFMFKKCFKMNFLEYLNTIRYEYARNKIINNKNNEKKTNIVMQCGFKNMQSFYRIEKKISNNYQKVTNYNNFKKLNCPFIPND